jgi:hypothetical protein
MAVNKQVRRIAVPLGAVQLSEAAALIRSQTEFNTLQLVTSYLCMSARGRFPESEQLNRVW